MTEDRVDHMITQYIWTLENDGTFVEKARDLIENNKFNEFRDLCGDHIRPVRRMLEEGHVGGILGPEWSFLYLEMWVRLGGFNRLMSNLYYNNDARFQIDRLEKAGYGVSRNGVIPLAEAKNPCAEILISQPQPCVLAEPEKEVPVSKKIIIANVTFINNVDVTTMNDAQLIDAIRTIENEINDLKAIKAKSVKIAAKILDAQLTLNKVVEILDAR